MKLTSVVPVGTAVVILLAIGFSAVWAFSSPDAEEAQPFLELPAGEEACVVEDTVYMRFQHMDLLLDLRDEVVRDGTLGEFDSDGTVRRITLDGCWECHTSRETFCNQCHDAVNLNLDCFRCHHDPSSDLQGSGVAHLSFNRGEK